MATAKLEKVSDELKCPIHIGEYFEKAVVLKCLHLLCEQDVDELMRVTGDDIIQCPICKRVTDRRDIKPDFRMRRIIDILKSEEKLRFQNNPCNACTERKARFSCKECSLDFCQHCKYNHLTIPEHKTHILEEIPDISPTNGSKESLANFINQIECDSRVYRERKHEWELTMGQIKSTSSAIYDNIDASEKALIEAVKEKYEQLRLDAKDSIAIEIERKSHHTESVIANFDATLKHVHRNTTFLKELLKDADDQLIGQDRLVAELVTQLRNSHTIIKDPPKPNIESNLTLTGHTEVKEKIEDLQIKKRTDVIMSDTLVSHTSSTADYTALKEDYEDGLRTGSQPLGDTTQLLKRMNNNEPTRESTPTDDVLVDHHNKNDYVNVSNSSQPTRAQLSYILNQEFRSIISTDSEELYLPSPHTQPGQISEAVKTKLVKDTSTEDLYGCEQSTMSYETKPEETTTMLVQHLNIETTKPHRFETRVLDGTKPKVPPRKFGTAAMEVSHANPNAHKVSPRFGERCLPEHEPPFPTTRNKPQSGKSVQRSNTMPTTTPKPTPPKRVSLGAGPSSNSPAHPPPPIPSRHPKDTVSFASLTSKTMHVTQIYEFKETPVAILVHGNEIWVTLHSSKNIDVLRCTHDDNYDLVRTVTVHEMTGPCIEYNVSAVALTAKKKLIAACHGTKPGHIHKPLGLVVIARNGLIENVIAKGMYWDTAACSDYVYGLKGEIIAKFISRDNRWQLIGSIQLNSAHKNMIVYRNSIILSSYITGTITRYNQLSKNENVIATRTNASQPYVGAIDKDGNILFCDGALNQIKVFTYYEDFQTVKLDTPLPSPRAIAMINTGHMLVICSGPNSLVKIE